MTKKYYSIALYQMIIVLSIAVIGIIFGTFFDLKISQNLVDTSSKLGGFVETIGETFAYMMIPLGGTIAFLGLYKRDKIYLKIIGYVILVLSLVISIYTLGNSFVDKEDTYGLRLSLVGSYILSSILMILTSILTYFLIEKDNQNLLLKIGLIIIIAMLLQFLLMHFLKRLACRPRYRFLIDPNKNTNGEIFKNWYQFSPFSFSNDFHKSWPSGHTATATITLLLSTLSPILRFKFKNSDFILFTIGLIYTLFIAYCRILYGAHYLSDVSFGLFFSSLICFTLVILFEKVHIKKKEQ